MYSEALTHGKNVSIKLKSCSLEGNSVSNKAWSKLIVMISVRINRPLLQIHKEG